MKIVLAAVAAVLLGPGAGASRLQARLEEACPDLQSECGLVDADDCAFEEPERPVWAEMTQEEFGEHKAQMVARREMMLTCVCCDHMNVEDAAALRSKEDSSGDGPADDGSAGRGFDHHHDHDGFGHHHHHDGHGHGYGHHHDGHGKERLQARVDEMCPDLKSECGLVDDGDCTFEKPARPDWAAMTEEEKEEHWSERQARRERMLTCICCDELSVEDAAALHSGGHGHGHGHGHGGRGKGASGFGGRVKDFFGRVFGGRGEGAKGRGQHKGHHKGCHPSPEKIQAELDKECPTFDCDGEGVEELKADCTWFDAVMAGEAPPHHGEHEHSGEHHNMRGGRGDRWEHWKNKRLSCGCCRGE